MNIWMEHKTVMRKQVIVSFCYTLILFDLLHFGTSIKISENEKSACYNEGNKWYAEEAGLYCCPCSLCNYGDSNSEKVVPECLNNKLQKYHCSPSDKIFCVNKEDFLTTSATPIQSPTVSTNNKSDLFTTKRNIVINKTVSTLGSRSNEPESQSHLLFTVLAVAGVVLLLLLFIYLCYRKQFPFKVKLITRTWKKGEKASNNIDETSVESDSFVSSPTESEIDSDVTANSKEELLSKHSKDQSVTKVIESYQEQPSEEKQRGRIGDFSIHGSESLPPSYSNNHPSSNRSFPGFPHQLGHSHPTDPQHYPSHGNQSVPFPASAAGPSHLTHIYPGPSPYPPYPGYGGFYPHHFPLGPPPIQGYPSLGPSISSQPSSNYAGAIILSNVDVKGDLNIGSAAPTAEREPQQPRQPLTTGAERTSQQSRRSLAADARTNLQPSSFHSTDIPDTASCSKSPPKFKKENDVAQRGVHLLRNDYEESRRRQGNTLLSEASTCTTKRNPSLSHGSFDLNSSGLRSRVAAEQGSRCTVQRHLNTNETPAKFFDTPQHSDASKIQPSSPSRATASDNSNLLSRADREQASNVSWPVQETSTLTDINGPDDDDIDIYQPLSSSDASCRR